MYNTHKINESILDLLKSGHMSDELALSILEKVNHKEKEAEDMDIAIIGMACRFPGANNINQFWDNLVNGVNSIDTFPQERIMDLIPFFPELEEQLKNSKFTSGYLDQISYFDHNFFNISYEEAVAMEPYQRVFMETAYQAMLNGGYEKKSLKNSEIGIYVGLETASKSNYSLFLPKQDMKSFVGAVPGLLSNRLSYFMDLRGPGLVINTACSSGLVSLHQACLSLKNQECEMAIAGGVNLMLFPQITKNLEDLETYDGKVKAFDKNADGTIWSEGVAAIILKPLRKAIKDRDHIHAVIKASGVNADGASNGLTAPNPEAETQLFLKTWERAQIDPRTISYIEAHGTGTLLGDSIEMQALNQAFRQYTDKKHICGIGSVKTNIGHTVAASGLASLIKVVLSLKHKIIPPTINFNTPNPYIDYNNSAVYVNAKLKDLKDETAVLRAGINSFGFGGTNCHVVIEEAPQYDIGEDRIEKTDEFHPIKCWPNPTRNKITSITPFAEPLYHQIQWAEITHLKNQPRGKNERILAITDDTDWGNELIETLRLENKVIAARYQSSFQKEDEQNYGISACYEDMLRLVQQTETSRPDRIIIASDISCNTKHEELQEDLLRKTLYTSFYLTKILHAESISNMKVTLLGQNVQRVTGQEKEFNPCYASMFGIGKVIREELPGIYVNCIDYEKQSPIAEIADEIMMQSKYYMTALRQGRRYIPKLEVCELENLQNNDIRIKEDGVYLITGGTGGIALEIIKYITKNIRVKLLLLSRTPFSMLSSDERTGDILQTIQQAKENGSEMIFYKGDVSDEVQMKSVFTEIYQQHGKIDGIFHAAGNPGSGMIITKEEESFTSIIAPKIKGTWILKHLTEENPPEFILLFSSISALVGGVFLGGYVAANSYLDAIAQAPEEHTKIISVNWTAWKNIGMMRNVNPNQELAFQAIAREDGMQAMDIILKKDIQNIVIGELNYNNSLFWSGQLPIELSQDIRKKIKSPEREEELDVTIYGREEETYTEYEKALAHIWGNVFHNTSINIFDNFFEIGGTSIIAIKIANRINEQYKILFTVKEVFTYITIAELADYISKMTLGNAVMEQEKISMPSAESTLLPLSFAQQQMWFLQNISPDLVAYNLPFVRVYDQEINEETLKMAFSAMIKRHVMMRTIFHLKDGNPMQEVLAEYTPVLTFVDLSEYKECQTILERNIFEMKMKPFDLAIPPYRICLYKMEEKRYCLTVIFHHILIDGWGMEVFAQELFDLYHSALKEEKTPLKQESMDYLDWVSNQYEWEQTENAKKQLDYWLGELKRPLPMLELPYDKKRPISQSYNGSYYKFTIHSELADKLKKHTETCHNTVNNCLMSLFFLLIHKLTSETDIIVGVPTAGRDKEAWEDVIGLFMNTICIRIKFEEITTFTQLEKQVKEKVVNAIDHSKYPFSLLVEKVSPTRDVSRNPIYTVLFQLYDNLGLENGGISQLDLSCLCKNAGNEIEVSFEYNTDLFLAETIKEYAKYYIYLLEQVMIKPDYRLTELELMTLKMQSDFKDKIKNPKVMQNHNHKLHELFEQQVLRQPHAVAALFGENTLTYEQLNQESNQLAWYLIENYECHQKAVCLMMDIGLQTIIGILGVLKAGGFYVPIDPNYPPDRIKYILKSCQADVLLTDGKNAKMVEEITEAQQQILHVIDVVNQEKQISSSDKTGNPGLDMNDTSLAYVMYTSGSTGNPKGVMVTHGNVLNFVKWSIEEITLSRDDVLMLIASISFDISVFEIFGTLLSGAKLCIISNEMKKDMKQLIDYMLANRVNIWHSVPSFMVQLLNRINQGEGSKSSSPICRQLRSIMIGGEAWSGQLAQQISKTFQSAEIRNMYGPTEATIWITSYKYDGKDVEKEYPVVPIGKAVSNNMALILDKDMHLCPPGVCGDIYITGSNVTKGYFNEPDKTREVFLVQPNEEIYYKTGDTGRYFHDGTIEYIGRNDDMVKVRGYRIELGEIDNAMRKISEIQQTSIAIIQEGESNKIVCFYIAQDEYPIQELKNVLRKLLPEYMIPAQFYHVDKLLVTPNGKTDWKSMLRLNLKDSQKQILVQNEYDNKLIEIWKTLLGVPAVGISENFFDLGGNSILVFKQQELIKKEFQIDVPVINLFRYTTIETLSDYLKSKQVTTLYKEEGKKKAELRKKMRQLRK